ncbi:hypothetical protein [Calothrix rhizosoleniae]|uniref:hypothetical protein n=1 Tax=Calothrix rhizosoleniae TaxID=888997 RepID=UPI00135672F3|nr:hypothetical protein [Calothrix rhizosoleniae]
MRIRAGIFTIGKPRKIEAAYSLLKYKYAQRKLARFTSRRTPPKTLGRPVKTESGGTA